MARTGISLMPYLERPLGRQTHWQTERWVDSEFFGQ